MSVSAGESSIADGVLAPTGRAVEYGEVAALRDRLPDLVGIADANPIPRPGVEPSAKARDEALGSRGACEWR